MMLENKISTDTPWLVGDGEQPVACGTIVLAALPTG